MRGVISDIIELLARLPGVGKKNATRLAFHLLDSPPEYANALGNKIASFHSKIKQCAICANMSEIDPCEICSDPRRDNAVLCVVERVPDLWAVESGGNFRGRYHVLNGLLAPLDGVGPDDLNLGQLVRRIETEGVEELIVATRPSVEGEATAMLVLTMVEEHNVKVTRIASGIPHGGELEYTDARTLERALQDRKEMMR